MGAMKPPFEIPALILSLQVDETPMTVCVVVRRFPVIARSANAHAKTVPSQCGIT